MIVYPIGSSGQSFQLCDEVLARFRRYQQLRFWHREAGGQLFAIFDGNLVRVVEATGPRATDRRTRTSYEPDMRAEQREIDQRFPRLHFIGDWHTHPEDRPSPSPIDTRSTAEGVRRSSHSLNAFVMVVVGRAIFPEALHVSVNNGSSPYRLQPSGPDV